MSDKTLIQLGEYFINEMRVIEKQHEQANFNAMFYLMCRYLTPNRPGIFGRIARYFGWSWGWLPIPEQDVQALEKIAKEWNIVERTR